MKWTTHDQLRSTVQSLASDGQSVHAIMRKLNLPRDEVIELMRDEPKLCDAPTTYPRGSDERILVYRLRVERGLKLFAPGDSIDRVPVGYVSEIGKREKTKYRKGANKNR